MRLTRRRASRRPPPTGLYAPSISSDASCLQRLAHRHQLARPQALKFRDLFGGVVVDAAAGLDTELVLRRALRDVGSNIAPTGQFLVEIAGDGGVDIEARHVEQGHRSHDGQLVADAPRDAGIEVLRFDDAL